MANILWTRTQDAECKKVKNLLARNNITYEERDLSAGKWKISDLQTAIPTAQDVPQLVLNDVVIGDFHAIIANNDLKVTPEKFKESIKNFVKHN